MVRLLILTHDTIVSQMSDSFVSDVRSEIGKLIEHLWRRADCRTSIIQQCEKEIFQVGVFVCSQRNLGNVGLVLL